MVDTRSINSNSARALSAKLKLWKRLSKRAGFTSPPITVKELKQVVGALTKAGYHSAMAYAGAAKADHLEHGYHWGDPLQHAWKKALRAATKGIGPPARATPFPILQLAETSIDPEPLHEQGPIHPRRSVVLCGWWMLRQIEAASLKASDVHLGLGSATVHLRSSKGDHQHIGVSRSLDCRCHQLGKIFCPSCLMTDHVNDIEDKQQPLFPDKHGNSHTLPGFLATLGKLGENIGIANTLANGKPRWGALSLRRGGVAMGASLGASATSLQHMARHAGLSIHRYMEGAPVIGLADAHRIPSTPRLNPQPANEEAVIGTPTPSCSSDQASRKAPTGQWNLSKRGKMAHFVDPELEASRTKPSVG